MLNNSPKLRAGQFEETSIGVAKIEARAPAPTEMCSQLQLDSSLTSIARFEVFHPNCRSHFCDLRHPSLRV